MRKQLERIRTEIVERTNEEILADKGAMTLFRELGSDQNIVSYAFNFLVDGKRNQNVGLLNDLNQAVFTKLSLGTDPGTTPGHEDVRDVVGSRPDDVRRADRRRLPAAARRDRVGWHSDRVPHLDDDGPWLTDTADGNFIPTLMQVMRETVLEAIEQDRAERWGVKQRRGMT